MTLAGLLLRPICTAVTSCVLGASARVYLGSSLSCASTPHTLPRADDGFDAAEARRQEAAAARSELMRKIQGIQGRRASAVRTCFSMTGVKDTRSSFLGVLLPSGVPVLGPWSSLNTHALVLS